MGSPLHGGHRYLKDSKTTTSDADGKDAENDPDRLDVSLIEPQADERRGHRKDTEENVIEDRLKRHF